MFSMLKKAAISGVIAAGSVLVADTANAQWGYDPYGYGPSIGGRSFYFGLNIGGPRYRPSRYSFYGPSYGAGYGYGMPGRYGYSSFAPSYGYYSGPGYVRPRGRLEYDVYTPFGRQEVEYKFRRDGRVEVDIDD